MRNRRWKLALAFLLPLALLASACGSDDDSDADAAGTTAAGEGSGETLTIYSGRDEELIAPLIEQFTEATGIEVEVRYGNSAEMGAALLEEGENTPADVFYSQEVGAVGVLDRADLLAPLPKDVVNLVGERFRPKENLNWVGVTGRSRVIVYNPDVIDTPPTSVEDLTGPEYTDQVAWAPGNGSFQAFITAFRVSQGEDAAAQWLEDMKDNGAQTYEGNTEVLEAVNNGDIGVGLINHYYWARSLPEVGGAENIGSEIVFPSGDDPGALVNATAAALTKGAADNPDALAFIEFLLSEEGQTYFVTETFEYPLVEGLPNPEGVPPLEELEGPDLDLTDLESLEETQALLTEAGLLS